MRARRVDVSFRDHNSPTWETGLRSANNVTHRKPAEDFGNLKKVSRVETRHRTRRVEFHGGLWKVSHKMEWGGKMKKPEEKDFASLSLCRRTFKLKGNKKKVSYLN